MMDGRNSMQLGSIDDDDEAFFNAVGISLPLG